MKTPTRPKPCHLVISLYGPRGDFRSRWTLSSGRERNGEPVRFRSIREAKRSVLLCADDIDSLTSCSYEIHAEAIGSNPPYVVRLNSAGDYARAAAEDDRAANSIGAMIAMGCTPVC